MDFPRLLFRFDGRDDQECTVASASDYAAKLKDGWRDPSAAPPSPTTTQTAWPAGRGKKVQAEKDDA